MKKVSLRQKIKYWFDNLMSKGTLSRLLLLGIITLSVVLAGALASILMGGPDGTGVSSPGRSFWFTLMHAINTGVLAKEEGTVQYLLVMTIVTLTGIFITSFLIGTISTGIKDKITELQRGKSRVIEEGHTVIIGFDDNIVSILEELVMANENQQEAIAVIMAEEDKIKMEEFIKDRVPDLGNLRVVCRSGKPDNPNDLQVCSLESCKAVIVNISDDFMTVKTILLCRKILDDCGREDVSMVSTVRDREVLQPAKIAGGKRASILNFQKTIARLMVQSGRHPGMSEILSELLSFKGTEIYVEDNPEVYGFSLKELNLRLAHSTAIGMIRNGKHMLNCSEDSVFEPGDKLIKLALDDDKIILRDRAVIDESVFETEPDTYEEPHTLLVLGNTDMLHQILLEEDAYSAPGSRVILAAEPGKIDKDTIPAPEDLHNIQVDVRECNLFKRQELEKLVAEGPTSIMLMSDIELGSEEADERTLMLQLHLNDIASEIGVVIPLTIEMNHTRNQRLSQIMRATDFVVSRNITAKMMVQIAEQSYSKDILEDLLSEEGSTIYMKPVTRYVKPDLPVDFYTLRASADRYEEIAIGYKKYAEDGTFDIVVNPPGQTRESFDHNDDLIVIAKI